MTNESYEKASELINDIKHLDNVIDDFCKTNCWIRIITPYHKENLNYSVRFQNELWKWLSAKREEYQREFDELQ